jgi:glycosyltransferase involved in cell wall biosynthesis
MKAYQSIRAFSPDLVHVHILTRIGFIGWRIARRQKVPLVISEHWSRYFPGNNTYRGWLRKAVTKFVIRKAAVMIAVSEPLRNAMSQCGLDHPRWRIVPNVIDTGLLTPVAVKHGEVKTMVHISCFEDRSKNISGFLRSLKELLSIRTDFACLMIGAGPDWTELKEYADFLGLPGSIVQFTGLKTGNEFTELLSGACFSVVSSRYETFGTVVIESLACGVPVVATAVGVAPEVINDTNGIIVPPGEETLMTNAGCEAVYQAGTARIL